MSEWYVVKAAEFEEGACKFITRDDREIGSLLVGGNLFACEKSVPTLGEVRRFLKGMYQGMAWAIENPNEAVDIILKEVSVLNRDTPRQDWATAIDHLLDEGTQRRAIGYLDTNKTTFTWGVFADTHKLKVKSPATRYHRIPAQVYGAEAKRIKSRIRAKSAVKF